MDEILEYLKGVGTYYLATVDADGNPAIRPFGTVAKIGDALYIQTGKVKDCYKQMEAHSRSAICAMASDGTWIRLEADMIPDDDSAKVEEMLQQYPELRGMYTPGDGNSTLLRMDNVKATVYSFTAAPKVLA